MTYVNATIKFSDGEVKTIEVKNNQTVLEAAEEQGVYLINDCREGTCGVCMCDGGKGTTSMDSSAALSTREIKKGKLLPCSLRAQSDIELYFDYPIDLCMPQLKGSIKTSLVSVEMISDSTALVKLDASSCAHTINFSGGQFVSMTLPGTTDKRSYSMANLPNEANELEFIIRILPDGLMSNYLRDQAKNGDIITLTPPKGSFSLRNVVRPLLLIAGGTGLSAIVSMLQELAQGPNRSQSVRMIYGVTASVDVCYIDVLEALKEKMPKFTYDIVAVNTDDNWQGPVGFVTDLMQPEDMFAGAIDAYLCGPPPMINAVKNWFDQSGLEGYKVHTEIFAPAAITTKSKEPIVAGLKPYGRAVVVGGSMSGMCTAKVLSDYFDEVIILDADIGHELDDPREKTPQANHAHHLLHRGQVELEHLFPGFLEELKAAGAKVIDASKSYRIFQNGSWKVVCDSGVKACALRRSLLEGVLRERIETINNIDYRYESTVDSLLLNDQTQAVSGVSYMTLDGEVTLAADLVVDSSGKNAKFQNIMSEFDYEQPEESEMAIEVTYSSVFFTIDPKDAPADWEIMTIYNHRPYERDVTYAAFYSEDKSSFLVTMSSYGRDNSPKTIEEFIEWSRVLQQPHVYDLIQKATPVTDVKVFKFPRMFRRHYEKLANIPAGFFVMGDAFASADPVSAAGMTKCFLEARALESILANPSNSLTDVPKLQYQAAAKIFDEIWSVLSEQIYRFPWVEGKRPFYQKAMNLYVDHVMKISAFDKEAFVAFLRVTNFTAPMQSLLKPRIVFKVIKHMLTKNLVVKHDLPEVGERREPVFLDD
ncbi:FAD-binding oxidoreductase [Colwellia sp. 12G3]|uniref:FAD-binding oxidoreductase n=1 Tax=Colwellia sp. 12G3 TaxID=2058299 RepID=UPI000C335E97|nr:FAD-binding oxidoreductase [Colwellia sp. 12G3]PKI16187.1 hypothetical protein CXF71_11130 [Colwellia sp. 12G3]